MLDLDVMEINCLLWRALTPAKFYHDWQIRKIEKRSEERCEKVKRTGIIHFSRRKSFCIQTNRATRESLSIANALTESNQRIEI